MPSAKIFFVDDEQKKLREMNQTPFEREVILQELLAYYPDLIPGDQIDPENPRRWLLVSREMGVPGEEKGPAVWSLDHLFIDQDGIPTFVECKRATDNRVRREVVAQMLDYAANGIAYWTIDQIKASAEKLASKNNELLDDRVIQLLSQEEEPDVDQFWLTVEDNLRRGRVRLIFIADHAPKELRRLVEFLNEQMINVEVLAVEVNQFIGKDGQKAIVPRVIGQTETAREVKRSGGSSVHITREQYIDSIEDPSAKTFYNALLDKAIELNFVIYWGSKGFSVRCQLPNTGNLASYMYGFPPNDYEFYFKDIKLSKADEDEIRNQLLSTREFRKAGDLTLKADITSENLDKLIAISSELLEKVKKIMKVQV